MRGADLAPVRRPNPAQEIRHRRGE